MLAVLDTRQDLGLRRSVALELVGDDDTWYVLQAFQQLAEESLRCFLTSLTLHQNIKDIAILIDGPPQLMLLALDLQKHFIQVPFSPGRGRLRRRSLAKV